MRARPTCAPLAVGAAILAAVGCSAPTLSPTRESAGRAPLPATEPYLRMTTSTSGWAVWPSGASWLVLHTTDGWAHVTNATPSAVPTGGGLVLTAGNGDDVAVAVRPHDELRQSPLLTHTPAAVGWHPAELPGPVTNARDAVAVLSDRATAVLDIGGGTVVTGAAGRWTTVLDAARLAPGGSLHLDGLTVRDGGPSWLTGHAGAGTTVAFRSLDQGQTWQPVAAGAAVGALPPCGAGPTWLLPVVGADGRVTVERTADGGGTWARGAPLRRVAGPAAWGCHGDTVWMAGRTAHGDQLFASSDGGGHWTDTGPAPSGLTDLVPLAGDAGLAMSRTAGSARLWAVSASGGRLRPIPLPAWTQTLGAGTDRS